MRFLLAKKPLLALTAFGLCASTFAFADGAALSTSSDMTDGTSMNVVVGNMPIEVKPFQLVTSLGAGRMNGPGSNDGVVASVRIDAATRIPLKFNGERAFETDGSRDGGVDIEFAPGIHGSLPMSWLDGETQANLKRQQDVTISGFNLLRLWKCRTISNYVQVDGVDVCESEQVGATVDLTFAAIGGKWFVNELYKTQQKGLELKVVQASIHFGAQFGIPVDFCAQLAAGVLAGKINVGEENTDVGLFAELSACAGMRIGNIAEIRDRFDMRLDTFRFKELEGRTNLRSFANTLSIEKIGSRKSPIGVYWRYSRQDAGAASGTTQPIHQNDFGFKGSWHTLF